MTTAARQAILAKIRRSLGREADVSPSQRSALEARIAAHRRNTVPARTERPAAELQKLFAEKVVAVHGTVASVRDMRDAPAAVMDYLRQHNLPARVTMAPDPTLGATDWDDNSLLEVKRGAPDPDDQVGVSSAFAAVAETGTLVTLSGAAHPSTLNFLPETHIVVVPADRMAKSYEDVWDKIRRDFPDGLPRTVNMITGPSRSGDIEQTLTLGAHGPRRLHVILVGDA